MAIVLPNFPGRRSSARSRFARKSEPAVGLRLLGLQPRLEPGETLEFEYCIKRVSEKLIDSLEASVMWYTEGKGSEDLGVHFFERLTGQELAIQPLTQSRKIATILPCSPLSYEGRLLKIRWCVRLRLFLTDRREIATERAFYLGHLTREV